MENQTKLTRNINGKEKTIHLAPRLQLKSPADAMHKGQRVSSTWDCGRRFIKHTWAFN